MCKGYRSGENHHRAKLTNRDVDVIFAMRAQSISLRSIARKMDCGKTTVWKILNGVIRGRG